VITDHEILLVFVNDLDVKERANLDKRSGTDTFLVVPTMQKSPARRPSFSNLGGLLKSY